MPEAENTVPSKQLQQSGSLGAREDRYHDIVESAVDFAILAMDRDGRVTDWNSGATYILGWSKGEIVGQLAHVIFTPEDQAEGRLEQEMGTALECGRALDERWHQRKDGSRFWAMGELMPLRTEAGEVDGFVKILRDRTAQHQQEERLRAQASTLQTITDHVSEAVFQLDARGNVTFVNAAAEAMFGWSGKELLGRNLHEALHHHHPDGRPYLAEDCQLVASLRTGEVLRDHEEVFFRQDGTLRHVLCTNAPVWVDGRISNTVLTVADITERRQADAALADTSRRLNAVLDNATVAVFLMDDRQHCAYMNAAAERLTGYTFAETQGRPLHDVIHHTRPDGSHFPLHECAIDRAFPENAHTQGEEAFVHKDGHFYSVAFTASPIHDEASRTIGTIIEVRDISVEKSHEAALHESAERLSSERHALEVLNRTGAQIAAELEVDRLVQTVVDAGVELTSAQFGAFFYNVLDEAGGKYMLYALSGAERSAFEKFGMPRATAVFAPTFLGEGVIRSADILKDERYGKNAPHSGMPKGHLPVRSYMAVPVTSRSGEVIGGLFFGHPEPDVFSARSERLMSGLAAQAAIGIDNARLFQAAQQANATLEQRVEERTAELQKTEEALRQAQKMEAVGQLTGGVAHDFNNLLTVIKSSTDLLKRPGLPEERRQRYIGAISDTVARAAKLTGQLLAFARRQALKPEVFDAGRSVLTISDMVGTLSGSRIKIVTGIPDEPCFINADPSQFDTALVNMAVNARDAMGGEGTLTITVHPVSTIPPIRSHPAVRGDFVAVCIEDTGSGIDPEQIDHIFEPFFTTKGVGQGTGLGLSQVFGFAKQSGGEVRVQSTVGEGTMFVLYLPRVEAAAQRSEVEPEPLVDGHGMCVLVVEDNADVGTFATQTLAELGYVTVWASNAEEALAELAKDADRFDVVFTDVVMPGMNGIDLAHRIRQDHHDLPVLLASGYSHVLAQNGTYGFELLHKPYSVEQLSRLLRKVATWQRRKRIIGL